MLKRACLFFVALSCAIFAADLGTAENPLTIDSENDLGLLRNAVNAGSGTFKGVDVSDGATDLFFKLSRDLDLSELCGKGVGNWTPIGTLDHPFKGNFDGNGKTIDYLYIDEPLPELGDTEVGYYGLFGVVSTEYESKTAISNLTIGENSRIASERDGDVGAVIGLARNNVVISDCKNKAYVSGRYVAGGIVGFAANAPLPDGVNIKNCVNEGFVNASRKAGGIVGAVNGFGVHIDSCTNLGGVAASDTAAGIVAVDHSSTMTAAKLNYLINKGDVSSGEISGGIIAVTADGGASIENCFNSGYVQASTSAAGIVGHLKSMTNPRTILTCVNAGDVFAGSNAGGIVGFIAESSLGYTTVSQSLNLGKIDAGEFAGGIVGNDNDSYFNADHNMNAGAVGFGYAGGIVGRVSADASEKVAANLSIAAPDTFAIYDSVMSHFEEDCRYTFDAAHAYVTDSLISGKTVAALGDSLWIYKEGYYPQIKTLAESPMKEIRDAQQVASTPVRLASDDDVAHITKNLSYTVKDPAGKTVDVYSARGNISFVNDSAAKPYSLGTDTLYVLNDNAKKKIIVNVSALAKPGSVENPLTISSVNELLQFRKALADSTEYKGVLMNDAGSRLAFKITEDLDLSSVCGPTKGDWTPIINFRGRLNGDNHKISNLYRVDTLEKYEGGLFSAIIAYEDTVVIENISLENVNIRTTKQYNAAALTTYIYGDVVILRNISVNGSIQGEYHTGGIMSAGGAGHFYLLDNTVEGSVITVPRTIEDGMSACMGGVAGCLITGKEVTISGNVNRAKVHNVIDNVGGIAGYVLVKSIIENNVNEGEVVSAGGEYLGGLFGRVMDCDSFVNNHNKGEIRFDSGNPVLGGLAGAILPHSSESVIEHSSNEGLIQAQMGSYSTALFFKEYSVGGLFGKCHFHQLTGLVNKGDVLLEKGGNSDLNVGGIMGVLDVSYDSDPVVIDSIVNTGRVEVKADSQITHAYVGGVIGYIERSPFLTMKNSANEGRVSITMSVLAELIQNDSFVGGLAGQINADSLYFVNNHNSGEVDAYSRELHEGGLVGILSDLKQFQIEKCYNEGNLYAKRNVSSSSAVSLGGLFGSGGRLVIKDSYNKGNLHVSNSTAIEAIEGTPGNAGMAGGIVGSLNPGLYSEDMSRIENVINIGNIEFDIAKSSGVRDTYIGGIVGVGIMSYIKSSIDFENVANYGSIRAYSASAAVSIAGVMGLSYGATNMKNIVSGGSIVVDFDEEGSVYNSIVNSPSNAPCGIQSAIAYGAIITKKESLYRSVADTLPLVLNTENWVNVKGYYSQLKSFAESTDENVRAMSALGATPIYLASTDSYVRIDSISEPFKATSKNALGEKASWSSNVAKVKFKADSVYFKALARDTLAMLTVESDGVSKSVWVRLIADETSEPEIEKDTLDLSKVVWTKTIEFDFDSTEHSVKLENVPEQVSVDYADASHTKPGVYHAEAVLSYDTSLYVIKGYKDSVLVWKILAGPTKAIVASLASNCVNLVYRGARTWALEFSQDVPANAKVDVVGIDGNRISVMPLFMGRSIVLQDMPTGGIALVRVRAAGLSKTFKIRL